MRIEEVVECEGAMIAQMQIDAAVVQAQLQECKLCKITIEVGWS